MPARVQAITSRDNPLLRQLRRLVDDGGSYRRAGMVWLEGDHLCSAFRLRGGLARQAVLTEEAWADAALRELSSSAPAVAVLPAALFAAFSGLASPAGIGFLIDTPAAPALSTGVPSLLLDRLQDPGNVGSILRSAAAFGVQQVLALQGTAALWSPKVLRAGMGAHFALALHEGLLLSDLWDDSAAGGVAGAANLLRVPWVATSSHQGVALPQADLPAPCLWVMGHEGQGVSAPLLARCGLKVRIPQPGGEESLNVAAAAAVCLYESARRAVAGWR